PIDNRVIDYTQMPSSTDLSKSVSKAMKAYGFKFVGPVTVYAFMQATGLINDHELTCEWHG
ncbi:MAG: DNA-3-methyladenine glycosylase I, partial [Weissella cibaria]